MKQSLMITLAIVLGTVQACSSVEVRPVDSAAASEVRDPDALFSAILADHVREGHVDYARLREDRRLEQYVAWLSVTDPDSAYSDPAARLAFWINAYNAYTLKLICDNYPVESINDLHFGGIVIGTVTNKTAWDNEFAVVGSATYSLNDIEHNIIRKRFSEPRIHFALVCAAVSCPPLRSEAYTRDDLEKQLDDQARVFLSEVTKNNFDMTTRTAHLSKIFAWYKDDFGSSEEALLRYLAPYLADDVAASMTADPTQWRIKHTDYDWRLNS